MTGTGELKRRLGTTVKSGISRASGAKADVLFDPNDVIEVGKHRLRVLPTPGHTAGCVTYYTESNGGLAFTGDALLIRGWDEGLIRGWVELGGIVTRVGDHNMVRNFPDLQQQTLRWSTAGLIYLAECTAEITGVDAGVEGRIFRAVALSRSMTASIR